jgi:hypothetical protein
VDVCIIYMQYASTHRRSADRPVPLNSDGDCHEDRGGQADAGHGIEEPAVQHGKNPVAVFKDCEGVDRDGGYKEHQVKDCKGYQQAVESVFP